MEELDLREDGGFVLGNVGRQNMKQVPEEGRCHDGRLYSSRLIISLCSLEEVKDYSSNTMIKTVYKMNQHITKIE